MPYGTSHAGEHLIVDYLLVTFCTCLHLVVVSESLILMFSNYLFNVYLEELLCH